MVCYEVVVRVLGVFGVELQFPGPGVFWREGMPIKAYDTGFDAELKNQCVPTCIHA